MLWRSFLYILKTESYNILFHVTSYLCITEQGAYSAPEPCVDEFPCSFPLKCILYDALSSAVIVYVYNLEVLIVLLLVPVQHVEVLGQLLGAPELVHVYEGVVRRDPPVLRL